MSKNTLPKTTFADSAMAQLLNPRDNSGYHYEFIGDPEKSKTIAGFIAPALGRTQDVITQRHFPRLETISKEWGICFAYPVYDNGHVVVQPECDNGGDFFTPAIMPETGREQFLDFHRLNKQLKESGKEAVLFPMMGGSGCDNIIPLIDDYFTKNPSEIDPDFKVFAFSNISNFAILGASDYCRYISSPFAIVATSAKTNPYCQYPAEQTKLLLQGKIGDIDIYQTPILYDPEIDEVEGRVSSTKLQELDGREIYHYPLNRGILDRRHKKQSQFDLINNWAPKQESWSFSIEGFIEECSAHDIFEIDLGDAKLSLNKKYFRADHAQVVKDFLNDTRERGNPPKLMELGVIAPSLGGESYYLAHDENGLLIHNSYNIERLQGRENPKDPIPTPNPIPALIGAIDANVKIDEAIRLVQQRGGSEMELTKLIELKDRIIKVPENLVEAIKLDTSYQLTEEHAGLIIEMEREAQKSFQNNLIDIAKEFKILVTLNARLGHIASNNITNGGINFVSKSTDDKGQSFLTMKMPEQQQKFKESSPKPSPEIISVTKEGEDLSCCVIS